MQGELKISRHLCSYSLGRTSSKSEIRDMANSFTANSITANSLTANSLMANLLTAISLTANSLTANSFTANSLMANFKTESEMFVCEGRPLFHGHNRSVRNEAEIFSICHLIDSLLDH